MSSNAARKRRFANRNDNAEGPSDRDSDYKDGKLKRKVIAKGQRGRKPIRKKRRQSLLPILVMRITRRILGG